MPKVSLGLIMILRNEAANLGRSLAPVVSSFDEVVVVDTGSTDDTAELCHALGAKVFEFAWQDDFAAARNFSIAKSTADWLFWLDGDNAITPAMVTDLRDRLPEGPAVLWALEVLEPTGGQLWQKRCFPRRLEVFFKGKVHEQLSHPSDWPSVVTPARISHWGYANHQHAQSKGRYYLHLLRQMLDEDPGDYYTRFQLARTSFNLRNFSSAIEQFSAVIQSELAREANPQIWAHAHFLLAHAYERLAQPDDSERILDELLIVQPSNGLAHYHRGRLAYACQHWEAAATHLNRALALGLDKPFVEVDPAKTLFLAEYYLGRSYERLGRFTEARNTLENAAMKQPDNPAPRTDLARLLLAQGMVKEAESHIKQVLAYRPGDRTALSLLNRSEALA